MNLNVKLEKEAIIIFFCVALLGCQTINPTGFTNRKFKDLEDYKRITQYIVYKNYHNGFKESIVIDRYNTSDSSLIQFMIEKRISGIYIFSRIETTQEYTTTYIQYPDSIIRFNFGYVPIFGKRKELYFDFSSNPPTESYKKKGIKQVIIEKGIYYTEY